MITTFTEVLKKEFAKSEKMGFATTFLFIPLKPNSQHMGKFDGAENVLQKYNELGYFIKIELSKTEHAIGSYLTISNNPIEGDDES